MKRNTKIFISISGIIIISLMLLGLTYGYFITRVEGNTKEESVKVGSGTSSILYTELSSDEESGIIVPGFTTFKVFTIENTGTLIGNYSIYLVNVINNFSRTEDVVYTLYKKKELVSSTIDINTDFSDWENLGSGEFPTETKVIKANESIEKKLEGATINPIYTYVLKITYIDHPEIDQNIDQGKTFSGKINIKSTDNDLNPFSEGTLAYNIIKNGALIKNPNTNEQIYKTDYVEKTEITKIADGTDIEDNGIFIAEDDYGDSYYFRGNILNNYVYFANNTWRIVRINGDGSVRLILNNTTGSKIQYNGQWNDNAYVGYMYGLAGTTTDNYRCLMLVDGEIQDKISDYHTINECELNGGKWTRTAYEATHANLKDSKIKTVVDNFYDNYLKSRRDSNNVIYANYLSDTLFCGDKSLGSSGTGYGNEITYYAANDRLFKNQNSPTPTLKCAVDESNNYSRYTVDGKITYNGITTNGDLNYPIGLLSADEVVYAGAIYDINNKNFYIATGTSNTSWLMTPSNFKTGCFYNSTTSTKYESLEHYNSYSDSDGQYTRPVINIKSSVLVDSGTGTQYSPYRLKLVEE